MKKQLIIFTVLIIATIIFFKPPHAAADISEGLVAHYPFDGNATDISGKHNDGTEYGELKYTKGLKGDAARFDGVDDYIRVPSTSSLNPVDQLTISFWVQIDGFTNTWSPIISKGSPLVLPGGNNREYSVFIEDSSPFYLGSAGDSYAQHVSYAGYAKLGYWTHYAGVIDRKNHHMKVYVDGILKDEIIDTYSTFNNNDKDLMIGWTEEVHNALSHFKGRIDELRIYNRALPENEVASLYSELSAIAIPPLTTVLHQSTFTAGLEGWTGYAPELSWRQTGGNPGGFLLWNDSGAPSQSLHSPSSFLGNWSSLEGKGFISFDQTIVPQSCQQGSIGFRSVSISGPEGTAVWHGPRAPESCPSDPACGWMPLRVPLTESSWIVTSGTWEGLLSNVTSFNISPEHCYGGEASGLDNVSIETVLTPSNLDLDTDKILVQTTDLLALEASSQKEFHIQLLNATEEPLSATLEVLNPHPELSISISQTNPITIASGMASNIPLVVLAGTITPGVYDDLLLKISTEDGTTFYSTLQVTIVEASTQNFPDLSISSTDIQLIDYILGESGTLQATVHNKGLSPAANVTVQFYQFGTLLGETVLDEVSANSSKNASITMPTGSSGGNHLIQVVVDSPNAITELAENNNEASKIVTWGTSTTNSGGMLLTVSLPSTVYTGKLFSVSGRAVYDVYVDGVRYTNYVVKGGQVQITIKDEDGNEWVYGSIQTNILGNLTKYLQAPTTPGTYRLFLTVTDKTFSATRELVFQVVEQPTTPPSPSLPPTVTGTGKWTYSNDTWVWTWTTLPFNAPTPSSDLRIFSENIYFSENNPDANEEITLLAKILYWATNSSLIANNIPINFYVTYPGTQKEKIGSTVISTLSVSSPDFGSRYVYCSWKNQQEGIYIVEAEIDPSYAEENMRNNAATRAIIVGNMESQHGSIQGEVVDPWGAAKGVTIELYNPSTSTLLSSTLTDDTGHYLFENLSTGNYQIHIITPAGYQADAEAKEADVLDQKISTVNFDLTKRASLCGDLDKDGDVDGYDRNILRAAFGTNTGGAGFIEEADYDEDGDIDYSDYQLWYACYKEYSANL